MEKEISPRRMSMMETLLPVSTEGDMVIAGEYKITLEIEGNRIDRLETEDVHGNYISKAITRNGIGLDLAYLGRHQSQSLD